VGSSDPSSPTSLYTDSTRSVIEEGGSPRGAPCSGFRYLWRRMRRRNTRTARRRRLDPSASRSAKKRFRVGTRRLGPGLDALEAALRGGRLPQEAVLDLRLVAEEILTNVAKYAHGDRGEHWVRVRLELGAGEVTLEFTDDGRPFDPLAARLPGPEPGGERPVGGLGLELVRSLVDAADYARVGSQNVLTLRKRVGGREGDVP
jgi:serine/threonine-protein kinase RsbW